MIFFYIQNFFKFLNQPQFIISALAPGGNLISAPLLSAPAPQHCNTKTNSEAVTPKSKIL
jgi:hypothetical protein